jgi:hypothetical protein
MGRGRHTWFLVSGPFGLFGTVWAYWKLEELGRRTPAPEPGSTTEVFAGGSGGF